MAFFLYKEYQLEKLAESFADNVYDRRQVGEITPENLLAAHTVIVQTRGMGEYLRQVLAEKKQIAGNLQMPFVNSFINDIFRKIYGTEFRETELRCDQKNIRKKLMRLFSSQEFIDHRVPELSRYISGVNAGLKRWQLAGKIADLFDQYQVYRFDRIEQLFSGAAAGSWQRVLYNELFNEQSPGRDHFFRRFLAEDFSDSYISRLPSEISVFGVGALPPVYLDIFVKLARFVRVNFFYLTPCLEFWEQQLSRRERTRLNAWEITESGNPVLQALGRQGRGFFTALLANEDVPLETLSSDDWVGCDDYPPDSTMLEIMQYDILHLFDRRELPENAPADEFVGRPRPDLKNDGSITLHNCHNIRRELEVLHDELLKLVKGGIKPRDIIVMAPDISRCAPVIHAVFGSGPLQNVYSIADMPPDESVMVIETFKRILSVAAGRFEFSAVTALLDMPMISYSLGLQDGDLNKIADLLKECGVRWGYDAAMHGKFCQSEFEEFSWQMVFDRLLAGFAHRSKQGIFGSSSVNLIGSISSVDALEGSKIELFARVVKFMENLAILSEDVNSYVTVKQWKNIFEKLLADFFKFDNLTRTALAPLRSAIDELDSTGDYASGNYPLNAVLEMLLDSCENSASGSRFLRGKITFCRMVPMRSIPHDVVAVLDLNEKDFPRRGNEFGFDLISLLPESGDRSATAQDRYLLLEALMSARKNLLLFYQGQSAVNNQECAASAPLNEIAEYLHNAFGLSAFKHKVSDIDPEYFKKDALFRSCSMESFLAAKQLISPAMERPEKMLPELCQGMRLAECRSLDLDELIRYFNNPSHWIMSRQMGIYLEKAENGNYDEEPWTLERKDFWRVDSLLLDMRRCCEDKEILQYARSNNILPPGRYGAEIFKERCDLIKPLPGEWNELLSTMERRPAAYLEEKFNCRLHGMLNMTPDGSRVIVYRCSGYKSRSALQAVLGSLLASAAFNMPTGAEILNIDSSGNFEIRRIKAWNPSEARKKITSLLEFADKSRRRPPALFEKSSVYYYDIAAAKAKYYAYNRKTRDSYGDATDPAVKFFYAPKDWSDENFIQEFCDNARMLYERIYLVDAGNTLI